MLPKINNLKSEWTNTNRKKALSALISPVIVAVLVMTDRHLLHVEMTTMDWNFIFLIAFLIDLLTAIVNRNNLCKICWLIGVSAISFEAIVYNFSQRGLGAFVSIYEFIVSFCGIWTILSIPVFVYLLVVCIRVIRWRQEDWEKIKELRRSSRQKYIEVFIRKRDLRKQEGLKRYEKRIARKNYEEEIEIDYNRKIKEEKRSEEQTHRRIMDDIRRKAEVEDSTKKMNHQAKVNELRRARELYTEQAQRNQAGLSPSIEPREFIGKMLLFFIISGIVVSCYFCIPLREDPLHISSWMQQAERFMQTFKGLDEEQVYGEISLEEETLDGIVHNINTVILEKMKGNAAVQESGRAASEPHEGFAALAEYTIFYIALVGTVLSIIFLLWKITEGIWNWILKTNAAPAYTGFSGFFLEYSTPFVILIVAVSLLLTLVTDGSLADKLPKLFQTLAETVMCILIILLAADAIRLILKQSMQEGSLLRTAMHLTFVLLVENVMGIVFSTLLGINLKETLSSLLVFFLGDRNMDIHKNVERTLNDSIRKEINNARKNIKADSNSRAATVFYHSSYTNWRREKR